MPAHPAIKWIPANRWPNHFVVSTERKRAIVGHHHIFETKEMRYLGGVIGLAIGYLTKYHLDKRYVFRTEAV